jgi:hypothetical protein
MALSPSDHPGTNSSLKRTVLTFAFPFFLVDFHQIMKKGPESLWIRGPWASLSVLSDSAPGAESIGLG